MKRADVLDTAREAVMSERNRVYGDPLTNFRDMARLWSVALHRETTPAEVALCLALLKVSRLVNTPGHVDSWVDLAGYAACGAEVAGEGAANGATEMDGVSAVGRGRGVRPDTGGALDRAGAGAGAVAGAAPADGDWPRRYAALDKTHRLALDTTRRVLRNIRNALGIEPGASIVGAIEAMRQQAGASAVYRDAAETWHEKWADATQEIERLEDRLGAMTHARDRGVELMRTWSTRYDELCRAHWEFRRRLGGIVGLSSVSTDAAFIEAVRVLKEGVAHHE